MIDVRLIHEKKIGMREDVLNELRLDDLIIFVCYSCHAASLREAGNGLQPATRDSRAHSLSNR